MAKQSIKKITDSQEEEYIQYLNDYYADSMTFKETLREFIYLTYKSRDKYVLISTVGVNIKNNTIGKLIKKYDPIRFNVGFQEWKK